MEINAIFFVNSIMLGVGLAMDAFSVSLANGLNDNRMKLGKMSLIAGVFAFFQALMPMVGWICIKTIANWFGLFEKMIPWIALMLLGFIGIDMIRDGIKSKDEEAKCNKLTVKLLLVQGVATSIDALSVGFTIADYDVYQALLAAGLIAAVTFIICIAGVFIGKKFGTKLAGKATIIGGIILVLIGIEIFVKNMFF